MKSDRSTSWLVMAVYLIALGMVFWPLFARSHETMGQWGTHGLSEYLFGHKIGSPINGDKVNCCLYRSEPGGRGDCRQLNDRDVKFVPGGYLWDGEFIAHAETNVSPPHPHTGEYHFYACKHDKGSIYGDNPKVHCFFAPPTGS
jgi:hypothetical protein